jgi:glucose/arabinose dehydrogenase
MTHKRRIVSMLALAIAPATQAAAQNVLGPSVRVASGLSQPLFVTAPAGDNRLFIVEKGGRIKVKQPASAGGAVSEFLDVSSLVNTDGERGLLGMAFDPGFATNGRFYVNYVDTAGANTVIARYEMSNPALNTAASATRTSVMLIPQLQTETNHKGGWIGFRPSEANNLYIATGDGGGGNDPQNNGQNPGALLGKMLRINVNADDYTPDTFNNYATPTDNPFVGVSAYRGEIWDYGLRNPFRNSFDRQTGAFYIADVGQGVREELNVEASASVKGRNYGWDLREGRGPTGGAPDGGPTGTDPQGKPYTDPVFDYDHTNGFGASIIGGYVYRGTEIPELFGKYVFGDYTTGKVVKLDPASLPLATNAATDITSIVAPQGGLSISRISSFGEDGFGELYVADITDGEIYKLTGVPEPTALVAVALTPVIALRRRRAS